MQTFLTTPRLLKQLFVRLFLAALAAALLATLASCGHSGTSDPGFDALSSQINTLNDSFTGSQQVAADLVFWQIAAALLIVLAGFALVLGAACGSVTRREVLRGLAEEPDPDAESQTETPTQTEPDHDNHDEKPQ